MYVYVFRFVYTYIDIYLCMYLSMYLSMYLYVYICMHTYLSLSLAMPVGDCGAQGSKSEVANESRHCSAMRSMRSHLHGSGHRLRPICRSFSIVLEE